MRKPEWSSNFPSASIHCFLPRENVKKIFDYTEKRLLQTPMTDSTKMNLALFYKKKGIYVADILHQISDAPKYFTVALKYFNAISEDYKLTTHYFNEINWNGVKALNYQRFLCSGFYDENIEYWNNCKWSSIGRYFESVNENKSYFIHFLNSNGNAKVINHTAYVDHLLDFAKNYQTPVSADIISLIKASSASVENLKLSDKANTIISLFEAYEFLKKDKQIEANIKLDSFFTKKPDEIFEYALNSLIENNALLLAKKSDNERCIKLLGYVKDTEAQKNIILNICFQLQQGEGVENTYFYMNELLKNYKSDAKIGMALYRLFGLIGGYEAEKNQAKNKYRNNPELLKPLAIRNWVIGTAENGNYYKAKNLIPENVSETKELILINQILKAEIIHLTKKNEQNAFIGNWNDTRYFELDLQVESINNDIKLNSLE
jgi:hypothetical protein